MKLYFLGGSFDPPHLGHLKIAELCIKQCDLFLFIPANRSPYKINQKLTSNMHRFNMLQLMTMNMDNVEIEPFEINTDNISYTHKTIDYLLNKYNPSEITMVIGKDHLNKLDNWRKIDYIRSNCKILCFNREKSSFDISEKIEIIKNFKIQICSTKIREKFMKNDLENMKNLINHIVLEYIKKNKLYK